MSTVYVDRLPLSRVSGSKARVLSPLDPALVLFFRPFECRRIELVHIDDDPSQFLRIGASSYNLYLLAPQRPQGLSHLQANLIGIVFCPFHRYVNYVDARDGWTSVSALQNGLF